MDVEHHGRLIERLFDRFIDASGGHRRHVLLLLLLVVATATLGDVTTDGDDYAVYDGSRYGRDDQEEPPSDTRLRLLCCRRRWGQGAELLKVRDILLLLLLLTSLSALFPVQSCASLLQNDEDGDEGADDDGHDHLVR